MMTVFGRWMRKLRGAKSQGEVNDGFEEEMAFHVEMETEKNVANGMDRVTARRKAMIDFGGANELREQVREELGWSWLGDFWRDAVHGLRVLRRRKGFAVSVIVTLGLCLGANTAFFAVLQSLVLENLPFENPERVVEISRGELGSELQAVGGNLSLRNEYAGQSELFEGVSFFRSEWSNIDMGGDRFRGNVLYVSPEFFETMGVAVVRGETLGSGSEDGSVWLAESIWESAYGGDESIVGRMVLIDGKARRVAGIAPRSAESCAVRVTFFAKIDRNDLLASPLDEELRAENEGFVWARLVDGMKVEEVDEALLTLEKRFQEGASSVYRENNDVSRLSIEAMPVQRVRTQWARSRLMLLNGGALLVLVIGCVNVANLLLAQVNARGEEFWVRRMLGARGGRLVRQCVAESVLLVSVSWLFSLGLAWFGVRFLATYSSELFRQDSPVAFGPEAFVYNGLIALLCMAVLGLLVGLRAVAASNDSENVRSSHQSTPGRRSAFLRSCLAVGQTAFTLALLIGGGLLVKSFYKVNSQDFGFDPVGVVTGRIHLTDTAYEEGSWKEAFKRQLLDGLAGKAGVESVSLSSSIPTFGFPDQVVVKRDARAGERARRTFLSYVSPGHLSTLGITLIEGRDFVDTDEFGWQTPVLVDERFARLIYPGESALGKRINLGRRPRNDNNWPVIVGVVESVKQTVLDGDDGMPMLYLPIKGSWVNEFSVFIKAEGQESSALRLLGSEVAQLDAGLPLFRSGSLDSVMAESLAGRRGMLWLCIGMGAVALVLSAVGVYGASAFRVSQRLREFAIRMAIGASQGRVISEHVGSDLRLAAFGLVLGFVFALQASRFLSVWLYEVDGFDWQVYASLTLAVALVYSISSYLPSRQGVRGKRIRL